jgi:serine/threonine protein kinase
LTIAAADDTLQSMAERRRLPSHLSTRLRRAPTRYEPKARLAAGGMAEVWTADAVFEDGGRHPVAIKRVLPELANNETYRSMFEDEARLGMALRHPNVVRVYDAREVAGTYIMIMELVNGTSLREILLRAHARHAVMPVPTALYIARELAKALEYAHSATGPDGRPLGIVHRDVSPHNLLLGRNGDVKLADFGLADATLHQTQLGEGMLGGKLGYLAPEIVRGEPTSHQIDLFGLGIVLWEMLCGRRLFSGNTDVDTVKLVGKCDIPPTRTYNRGVTDSVERFMREILAASPRDRTPTADAAVAHLDALLIDLDPEVGPRDVALVVGLHLANQAVRAPATPLAMTELLAHELNVFAEVAAGEGGATPLDPDSFLIGR